ncbi:MULTISPECIES: ABC transporter ATP-binding protein [unclassified Streptomyces]|uniref:ABC transporter ATP-binding protein n=1 Tax=unclassified Streptomyces TaxID=2593676 RepID=UPI00336ADDCB
MRPIPDPRPGTPDTRSPLRYLVHLIADRRGSVLLATVSGIVCALAQGLVPAAVGRGVDAGLIPRQRDELLLWGGTVLALGVVQALSGMLRDRSSENNRFGAGYLTMQYVTRHATRLGATLPKQVSTGQVVSVGAADITRIGAALESTARGSGAVVSTVVVAGIMLATSWQLGLVTLAGVPLMAWLMTLLMRRLHGRQRELRESQGAMTDLAMDIVDGLRVLRGIGGEEVFARRYREASQRVRHHGVRVAGVGSWISAARILLPGLLVTVIVTLGAHYVETGRIGAGALVSFYGFAVFLADQLSRITGMIDQLTRALVAARQVTDFLTLEPEPTTGTATAPADAAELTDPESGLVLPAGRFVGVVCTEQEDAALLADRLGRYTDSKVTYGGVALSALPLAEVRRLILVADNDSPLFSGPLRTELDPRDRALGDERLVRQALDDASALDVLDTLPGGADGDIGVGGREFSGGQQQRLRLARALLADPEVLILIEPSNAVDAHTEGRIAARLAAHRSGRTTAVFTTSPILLDHTDQAVLVDGGQAVATGPHHELLADPRYRSVVTREVVTT